MLRTFQQHHIRPEQELSGLYTLTPGEGSPVKGPIHAFVPGCWQQIPGLESYRGVATYERSFQGGGNLRFMFKGVSHKARVFLDGRYLGEHEGAYTPFELVAPGVAEGKHRLCVEVDNRFSEESALHVPNDYMTYGGISRPVAVQTVPELYVERMLLTPVHKDGSWALDVRVWVRRLAAEPAPYTVTVDCLDHQMALERTIQAADGDLWTGTLSVPEAQTYEPDHPVLYYVGAVLQCGEIRDDLIERVGFRTVSVEGDRILFNGKPFYIKGFNRHEDHPAFGCALPPAAIDQDLQIARDLGANALRTCHYPNDEVFLDLCDERGMLVWEEGHARGLDLRQMENPHFDRQSEDVLREMILHHYNHPSIFIWGILNECAADTDVGYEKYKRQYDVIRSLDSTRPVTSASCRWAQTWLGQPAPLLQPGYHDGDITLGLPDVVSYNLYPAWYVEEDSETYIGKIVNGIGQGEGSGKPILISEIGAGAVYGYRHPSHDKWTEEYQADALREQLQAVFENKALCGVFIWQFCDCRVSREWFYSRPRTLNNKGIVDEFRRPKLAYAVVKELFSRQQP